MTTNLVNWTKLLMALQDAIGKTTFYPLMNKFLSEVAHLDEILVLEFIPNTHAQLIWQNKKIIGDQLDVYLTKAFVLDPFYTLGREKKGNGFFRLNDISAEHNRHYPNYFNQYFRLLKIKDEVGFLIQLPTNNAFVHIEMARFQRSESFSNSELDVFNELFPQVERLVVAHHKELHKQMRYDEFETSYVEDFHRLFGTETLTPREHDVCLLMLQGYSVKAIAGQLSIGDETIKMHRKNIYAKLGLNSQPELLALFIELLVMIEPPVLCDPLIEYLNKRWVA
ncbi:LuxR C-terminal-related transcriptional regulator [Psychrosphaera aquimarina]|uniref:LuxR C-terminal-related transcriptional regulator n=1 Tax=Psychrosphaera aquimarina TaxID=2044854 RepID=A0ABU3R0N3_9GAMM|nr:LuxR C-terminal-related transcriptional regulator [Psychrosphaera aquimarina]MDU0113241.1 LuxR C-terminal-related transcriptional regulator [Psychrosphaera aquimarina]